MKKAAAVLIAVIICTAAFAGCAGTYTEKTYSADGEEVNEIVIDVKDRELEISPSADGQIRMEYFDGENECLKAELSGGTLYVKLATDKGAGGYIGVKAPAKYRKIKLFLPQSSLSALTVSTTNGDIKVSGLYFKQNVALNCNGGNIVCDGLGVGKAVALTVKNGDITGGISGGWDEFSIFCKIKKGNCNLPERKEGGEKTFTADCNNGDIDINFVKQ